MAFTLDASLSGNYKESFSLDAFRNANKFELFLVNDTSKVKEPFFSAYYQGNFAYNIGLEFESYTNIVTNLGKLFTSPLVRSTTQSVSRYFTGSEMSGAFDAPMKPFIQGTKPLSFDIEVFLPLIKDDSDDENSDPFYRNILIPINTLLKVCVPDANKTVDKVGSFVTEKFEEGLNWVFPKDTTWYSLMSTIVEDWRNNFFEGVAMLDDPIQFVGTNTMNAKIAGWTINRVIVTDINVSFSPLIYASSDGKKAYPSYAKVGLSLLTKDKAKVSTLNIGTDYSEVINDFLPDSEKTAISEIKMEQV